MLSFNAVSNGQKSEIYLNPCYIVRLDKAPAMPGLTLITYIDGTGTYENGAVYVQVEGEIDKIARRVAGR